MEIDFFTILEGTPKSKSWQFWFLLKSLSLAYGWPPFHCVFAWAFLCVCTCLCLNFLFSKIKTPVRLAWGPTIQPYFTYLFKDSISKQPYFEVPGARTLTYELGEGTIQLLTVPGGLSIVWPLVVTWELNFRRFVTALQNDGDFKGLAHWSTPPKNTGCFHPPKV